MLQKLPHIFTDEEILQLQQQVAQVYLSDQIIDYLLDLTEQTRKRQQGLSTRGVLALKKAAQAHALIEQRDFVSADDVQAVFIAVSAHRIGLSEAQTQSLMQQVVLR